MQIKKSMKIENFPFSSIKDRFTIFFREHERKLISFFKELVEINSYSYNLKGIEKCLNVFKKLVPDSLDIEKIDTNLIISNSKKDYVLLMGHMDTVFPEDMGFNKFIHKDQKIFGPGVFDMKGGLIVALFSLIFLDYLNLLKETPILFLVNSDEEIGSINSKELIESCGRSATCAFVFEGGGENGEVVVGRKGKIGIKVETRGKASHAAFVIKDKPSAILEMAHKVIEFENINNEKEKISANVGKIKGGIGPNTVPDLCSILLDFRFSRAEQEKILFNKVKQVCEDNKIKGVQTSYEIISSRPCMESEKNMELYSVVREVGEFLGYNIGAQIRPGVSDANFIASVNTPVIDGMGPLGANDHSKDEYVIESSIPHRILLTSLSILSAVKNL